MTPNKKLRNCLETIQNFLNYDYASVATTNIAVIEKQKKKKYKIRFILLQIKLKTIVFNLVHAFLSFKAPVR